MNFLSIYYISNSSVVAVVIIINGYHGKLFFVCLFFSLFIFDMHRYTKCTTQCPLYLVTVDIINTVIPTEPPQKGLYQYIFQIYTIHITHRAGGRVWWCPLAGRGSSPAQTRTPRPPRAPRGSDRRGASPRISRPLRSWLWCSASSDAPRRIPGSPATESSSWSADLCWSNRGTKDNCS